MKASPITMLQDPSKHGTITQCCFNVGPACKTLGNIETVLGEWYVFAGMLRLRIQQTQCRSGAGPAS